MIAVLALVLLMASFGVKLLELAQRHTDQATLTATRLQALDKAMARFVTLNRRLPCPADGRIDSAAVGAGVEQRNGAGDCTTMNFGVVPWVALQIQEADALDGYGNRFTYRVPTGATGFTRDLAFDMSACAAIGTAATTTSGGAVVCFPRPTPCPGAGACTSPANYMANRGLMVRDGTGAIIMNPVSGTGAAFVVISGGENRGGVYLPTGVIGATQGTAMGAGELTNRNNQALQANYVDAIKDSTATNTHFDDVVLRPTISDVLTRSQLGPRP